LDTRETELNCEKGNLGGWRWKRLNLAVLKRSQLGEEVGKEGGLVMSSNFCPHLIFEFGDLIEFSVLKDWFN